MTWLLPPFVCWGSMAEDCWVCVWGWADGFIYESRTLCSSFSKEQLRLLPFLAYFIES